MSIVTISRGSYSKGKEIAEKLAKELDYECTSRDILLETSEHFKVPELKLVRAIHDAPSILDRMKYTKERYVAYFCETFLEHMQKDNIVYHGLAGHFLLQGLPNVLKVRIIASFEDRVKEEMKREGISKKEARRILIKDDEERRKWSKHVYGIDTKDSSLYDIVLHIDTLTVDDAVEILADMVRRSCFQTNEESARALRSKYLAAGVKVALLGKYPDAQVDIRKGTVTVTVEAVVSQIDKVEKAVKKIAAKASAGEKINVNVVPLDID